MKPGMSSAIRTTGSASLMAIALLFMPGCLNAEKKTENRDEISLKNEAVKPTRQEPLPVDDRGGSFVDPGHSVAREVRDMREQFASNQVVKNDIQGVGVQVAKVAEELTAIKGDVSAVRGDLAHIEATFNLEARIDSKIDAKFEAVANVMANFSASIESKISAFFNVTIAPKLEASASAEAAFMKRTENWAQTNTSGRDSVVTNFPKEAVDVIVNMTNKLYWTMVAFSGALTAVVSTFAGLIVKLCVNSRRRADARANTMAQLHFGRKLHEN